MVAAIELEQQVAPRGSTGKPKRAHGGLCSARDEAHHLHMRHALAYELGQGHLEPVGNTKAGSPGQGVTQRVQYHGRGVPEHERSPRQHVVDILVVVHVPDAGALPACHDERLAAYTSKCTHRRVHAAREQVAGARHRSP